MSATSVPKKRLVNLIVSDLNALEQAIGYFHITSAQNPRERLLAFTKGELIAFILTLGEEAESALRRLESSFPFRKPPTLYLGFFNGLPDTQVVLRESQEIAQAQLQAALFQDENMIVRAVYMAEPAQITTIDYVSIIEFQILYEVKVEYVEADTNNDDYGQLKHLYSLETAYAWNPIDRYHHAIIACCDYQALRPIRKFLQDKFHINLQKPWLTTEMMQQITQGADPRSVTYSLRNMDGGGDDDIQSITYSDPNLNRKHAYITLLENHHREPTYGFYMNHPGLALSGIGIARRDGKVWTPKRLEIRAIAHLAMTLITQTEAELERTEDRTSLVHYFHGFNAEVGGKNWMVENYLRGVSW